MQQHMGPQLHVSIGSLPPTETLLKPVQNRDHIKPNGGLWTSSYMGPAFGSDWVQWSLHNNFNVPEEGWNSWILYPSEKAKMLVIDGYQDLHRIMERFKRVPEWANGTGFDMSFISSLLTSPDYEELAEIYDGIHLTKRGQIQTHLSQPYSLYGYDCESTLWFRWVFNRVEELGTTTFAIYSEGA